MIIILEGADNTGKTNIANEFIRLNPEYVKFKGNREADIFKFSGCKELPYIQGEFFVDVISQLKVKNLIIDRFYPSEFVYSKVYNRYQDLGSIFKLENSMKKLGAVILYCYKTEYKTFEDELVEFSQIERIKEVYDYFLSITNLPFLVLDTTDEDLDREMKVIKEWLSYYA